LPLPLGRSGFFSGFALGLGCVANAGAYGINGLFSINEGILNPVIIGFPLATPDLLPRDLKRL
jgi:hypothetical protein